MALRHGPFSVSKQHRPTDDQGTLSCCIYERLVCIFIVFLERKARDFLFSVTKCARDWELGPTTGNEKQRTFIVCETMLTIGESRVISRANDTGREAPQIAGNLAGEDFLPKLLWRMPTKIHRERRK